jgi:HAD superfamily hydrolase (TIGR01509 family)
MTKAVIFDFDSTLVDYARGDGLAIERVRGMAGICEDPDIFYRRSKAIIRALYARPSEAEGDILRQRIDRLVGECGVPSDDRYLAEYLRIYLSEVAPYDGVALFLDILAPRVKIGLLTNSIDSGYQRIRIAASGLERYFDAVCIANEIGHWKPHREAFLAAARMLGEDPRDCLFIGDSEELDVAGALGAGMRCVKRSREGEAATRAEFSFCDYGELVAMIDEWL